MTTAPARSAARTLITVAPTGAETAKADVPTLPTTPEELVETAVACEAAGAALIHIHVRDADHRPTLDPVLLKEAVVAVREATDLVVQLSTGGAVTAGSASSTSGRTDGWTHRARSTTASGSSCPSSSASRRRPAPPHPPARNPGPAGPRGDGSSPARSPCPRDS